MNPNFVKSLGLAQRAGKCVSGEELIYQIDKKKIKLVLIASDASDRTKETLVHKCERSQIPYLSILTRDELSTAIGKNNRVAVGISDEGFSKLLNSYL